MIANSGMKHESETILEVIRGQVLDFVLYFIIPWQSTPLYVTSAQFTS